MGMTLLCLALAAALVVVAAKWLLLRREVGALTKDITRIHTGHTNRQLRVRSQDKEIAALACAVNQLYEDVDRITSEQASAGQELRQNMADISHDLRTPLTSILGYLGLLAKPDNTPEQTRQYLSIATQKAEALRKMVDSLFELARLEAGAYTFEAGKLDGAEVLAQEIAACYEPFAALEQEPAITLPEGPLLIWADTLALQRVFANLLQNILRHGGTRVRITAARQGDEAVFTFANRAAHLSPEDVERLFNRSYTADKTRSSQNTGLGLAITREFTQQMGGTITGTLEGEDLAITLRWPLAE